MVLLILISFLLLVPPLHRPVIADIFKCVGMTAWSKCYSDICVFNCVHSCSVKYSGKQFLQHLPSFRMWPSEPLQSAWTAVTALPVGHCVCFKGQAVMSYTPNLQFKQPPLHIPQSASETFPHSLVVLLCPHHVTCLRGWDLAWAEGAWAGSVLFRSCDTIPGRVWPHLSLIICGPEKR